MLLYILRNVRRQQCNVDKDEVLGRGASRFLPQIGALHKKQLLQHREGQNGHEDLPAQLKSVFLSKKGLAFAQRWRKKHPNLNASKKLWQTYLYLPKIPRKSQLGQTTSIKNRS